MLKKIFISAILLIAVMSFVVSLLGGKNSVTKSKVPQVQADKIAVISVDGTIASGDDQSNIWNETVGASSGTIMRQLRKAAKDDTVKAVLLSINSPGGSVTAAEEITREINRFKETSQKPIVATMSDMGASAAYYIAAPCDKIYVNNSTLTGSIGVYMSTVNYEELAKKLGVYDVMIKSGPHKDIMSPNRPMTAEERAILQNIVNEMYDQFVVTVASGRKMPEDKVRRLADGRIYTGKQAKELGLVDEIGDYYDAVEGTAQLANISGTPNAVRYNESRTWRNILGAEMTQALSNKITEQIFQNLSQETASKQLWAPRS